jgi:membrane fusion protein, multidrug efflux system
MEPRLTSLIFLTFLLLNGCQAKKNRREADINPVPVITVKASESPLGKEISLSGNIEGNKTVRLGFMVAGKIDFISAEEGEQVSRNKLLASLDPASYEIAKELADIQVNQVQDEYDRLKSMHDRNSLSESDFAKISYGLQQAKAQQKLNAKNLADTKLYSPIDGVLLKRLAEPGEITGVGIPQFVVSDIRKIKVNAFIPENELHNIKIGQTAKVTIPSINRTCEGKITEVGSAADPASRAFSIKIEISNPDLVIRPGMIAEATILAGATGKFLGIPVVAIQHDYNDQSFIYIVDTLKNRAFRRNVSLGKFMNDWIEITSGLNENEIVVAGGQQNLVDGSPVSVQK